MECVCCYHWEERDQLRQEMCEFVGRLRQVIENHVDDGVFVLKRGVTQHQQLGSLCRGQQLEDLKLSGRKGRR